MESRKETFGIPRECHRPPLLCDGKKYVSALAVYPVRVCLIGASLEKGLVLVDVMRMVPRGV